MNTNINTENIKITRHLNSMSIGMWQHKDLYNTVYYFAAGKNTISQLLKQNINQ